MKSIKIGTFFKKTEAEHELIEYKAWAKPYLLNDSYSSKQKIQPERHKYKQN